MESLINLMKKSIEKDNLKKEMCYIYIDSKNKCLCGGSPRAIFKIDYDCKGLPERGVIDVHNLEKNATPCGRLGGYNVYNCEDLKHWGYYPELNRVFLKYEVKEKPSNIEIGEDGTETYKDKDGYVRIWEEIRELELDSGDIELFIIDVNCFLRSFNKNKKRYISFKFLKIFETVSTKNKELEFKNLKIAGSDKLSPNIISGKVITGGETLSFEYCVMARNYL